MPGCSVILGTMIVIAAVGHWLVHDASAWQCNICTPLANPCRRGRPLRAVNGQQYTCNYNRDTLACPSNYWCHVGGSTISTCCCPKPSPVSPCEQPVDQGTGYMALPRWFYDKNMDKCIPFLYRGLRGNENNFVAQQQCRRLCEKGTGATVPTTRRPTTMPSTMPSTVATTQTPAVNPCCCGEPAQGPTGYRVLCMDDSACPPSYWCHVGASVNTTACCPVTNPSRCDAPYNQGKGGESLQRWFYDRPTGRCEQFTYLGIQGLENHFLTKEACESECDVLPNPCPDAIPGAAMSTCTSSASCPIGQWCHIGQTAQTTVCCPNAVHDVCALPKATGTGSVSLQRWHMDAMSGACGQCRQFTYTGAGGNQNNFLTQSECERSCPGCGNPCPVGEPLVDGTGQLRVCQTYAGSATGSCPAAHWCHVGAAGQPTTACCPSTVGGDYDRPGVQSICDLPLDVGEGTEQLQRWYLSKSSGTCGTCVQFTYFGTKGNENMFQTQQACEAACPPCVNPCAKGEPLRGSEGRPMWCSPSEPCPNTHWCHVGASARTTLCCLAVNNVCTEEMSEGEGSDSLQRWYYDAVDRQCQPFTYKGLKGSQNMFLTLEDCESIGCPMYTNACPTGEPILQGARVRVCSESTPCPDGYWCHIGPDGAELTMCCRTNGDDPCTTPVSYGQGAYQVQRYYYEPASRTCRQFTYAGMKGNVNNFLNEVDCAATCPVFQGVCADGAQPLIDSSTSRPFVCDGRDTAPCSAGYFCLVGSSPSTTQCCPTQGDPCNLPQVKGAGTESLPRWYYDTTRSMCRRFIYTGRYGNENNFVSYEACRARCPELNPCGTGLPLTGSSGTPTRCDSFVTSGGDPCPSSYYCHVGPASPQAMQALSDTDFTATVCCPAQADRCDQPQSAGEPLAGVPLEPDTRWFYDRHNDLCTQFRYNGMGGNQNNFLTSRACEEGCPGYGRLCPHLRPLLALGVPQTCGVEQACPQGYLCNVNVKSTGAGGTTGVDQLLNEGTSLLSEQTGVCCPNPADFCFESRLAGEPCTPQEARTFFFNEDIPLQGETRYGYDPDTNECVSYKYLGCGGSKNNFLSLQKCTEICCNEFRKS